MAKRPTVWIINEGGHAGYTKASKFGNLVALTKGNINPFRPDRLALNIAKLLKHAGPEDYLLLSGPPIANALALYLWFAKFQRANLLLWSTKGHYEVRQLDSDIAELMGES